jgi:hypothetical protein
VGEASVERDNEEEVSSCKIEIGDLGWDSSLREAVKLASLE